MVSEVRVDFLGVAFSWLDLKVNMMSLMSNACNIFLVLVDKSDLYLFFNRPYLLDSQTGKNPYINGFQLKSLLYD